MKYLIAYGIVFLICNIIFFIVNKKERILTESDVNHSPIGVILFHLLLPITFLYIGITILLEKLYPK